jgi:hypothetical protein
MVIRQTGEHFTCHRGDDPASFSEWGTPGWERSQLCVHEYRNKGFEPVAD